MKNNKHKRKKKERQFCELEKIDDESKRQF